MQLTPDLIVAVTGILISVLFSYFPALSTYFAQLPTERKSMVMLGLMAATAGVMFGLGCVSLVKTDVPCTGQGAWVILKYWIEAVVGNQAAYLISPQTKKVESAIAGRDFKAFRPG